MWRPSTSKSSKGNTAYLSRLIDANIESYRAIKNAGHEILPKDNVEFEGAAYHKTCLRFLSSCPPRASERSARPTMR